MTNQKQPLTTILERLDKNLDKIKKLVEDVYDLLKEEVDSESEKTGVVVTSGKLIEELLCILIELNGKEKSLINLKNENKRGIYEYSKLLYEIIPTKIQKNIKSIQDLRNEASHHTDHDNLNEHEDELNTIKGSLKSIVRWVELSNKSINKNRFPKKTKKRKSIALSLTGIFLILIAYSIYYFATNYMVEHKENVCMFG